MSGPGGRAFVLVLVLLALEMILVALLAYVVWTG